MTAPPRNLVNLNAVDKGYGSRSVLRGRHARRRRGRPHRRRRAQRRRQVDAARLRRGHRGARRRRRSPARAGWRSALLGQGDDLDSGAHDPRRSSSAGAPTTSGRATPRFRDVLDGLLGGVGAAPLRGGARHADRAAVGRRAPAHRARPAAARRARAAAARRADEPPRRRGRRLARAPSGRPPRHAARRHPRPLVPRRGLHATRGRSSDGAVHQYEGGYAAYVLARAERDRAGRRARGRAAGSSLRKELAWLRRGPPARTSKPKFRIEAANALIADEPEPRDRVELLRFASARLGDEGARRRGRLAGLRRPRVLRDVDLAARPGRPRRARRRQRLGQDDAASTAGGRARAGRRRGRARRDRARSPTSPRTRRRSPATCACSSRSRRCAARTRSATGRRSRRRCSSSASASAASSARTLVRDLSGGERRRLQLMRLLMDEPNVLLLDEPTNDLDIDTLTALEDLLDGWPGTLVVVSHDRYFVERVCDDVFALDGDGAIRHLPGGIEQYVALRARRRSGRRRGAGGSPAPRGGRPAARRATPARRSRGSSGRSTGSPSARPSCTRRWPPPRPTTSACASCSPSSRRSPASATRGGVVARDVRGARGVTAGRRDRGQRGALSRSVDLGASAFV